MHFMEIYGGDILVLTGGFYSIVQGQEIENG